jgi:hypothetical protein
MLVAVWGCCCPLDEITAAWRWIAAGSTYHVASDVRVCAQQIGGCCLSAMLCLVAGSGYDQLERLLAYIPDDSGSRFLAV